MEQRGFQVQKESFFCCVCLELLREPVTIPCGHSYCRTCISSCWDGQERRHQFSCPQCRETFAPRPVLVKSTVLAELVEEIKRSRIQEAAAVQRSAAAEDQACDVCVGGRRRAVKSCLNCVASYCETHLQPHHRSAALKRHKLVDPSKKLQENICSLHDEVMKIFCRTDQQCICLICSMEEHKGHHVVSAAAESIEKRRELQGTRSDIHKNIQDREKELRLLEEQLKSLQLSADHTVEQSRQVFTELIDLLSKTSSELEKGVRSKQQTEVSSVRSLQEKLEEEIRELKERDAELKELSLTEDPIQLVHSSSSLSVLSVSTHSPAVLTDPVSCFLEVTAAVSELRDHLHDVLMNDWTNVCEMVEKVDVLEPPEPTSRAGFLQYSQELTLDPNTAHRKLQLSEGNRKVTRTEEDLLHPDHPERFTGSEQVLSRESLTGRSYWEVEWTGTGVRLTVAYKSISRDGSGCGFGCNDKSWSVACLQNNFILIHNSVTTALSDPRPSRIGVYVDEPAGSLSFYSVGDTMTLLHRVLHSFTEPLHAGVWIYSIGDTAELCKL